MVEELLTPKQVARAIGVSESSLKRWCDRGLIPTVRTAGGHRRLPISGVVGYLRRTQQPVVDAAILGLPASVGRGERILERSKEHFLEALVAGQEERCRQVVFDAYLAGHPLAAIFDRIIAESFHTVGESWACGDVEVYQERRACEMCLRLLHELRLAVPAPPKISPRAIGGTPSGDHYTIPTTMVELVLRDEGYQAVSLGTGLPFDTLSLAIVETRPALFWLSVSHLEDSAAFLQGYQRLYATALAQQVALMVGGRALSSELRRQMQYTTFCDNLRHVQAYLASQKPGHDAPPTGSSYDSAGPLS